VLKGEVSKPTFDVLLESNRPTAFMLDAELVTLVSPESIIVPVSGATRFRLPRRPGLPDL